jgi:hypothetical protein
MIKNRRTGTQREEEIMNPRNAKLDELKAQARANGRKVKKGEMSFEDAVQANSSSVFAIETEHPELFPSPDKLINLLDQITEKAMS